jgi:hypothetical protein
LQLVFLLGLITAGVLGGYMYLRNFKEVLQRGVFFRGVQSILLQLRRTMEPARAHRRKDKQGHYDLDGVSFESGKGVIVASAKNSSRGQSLSNSIRS